MTRVVGTPTNGCRLPRGVDVRIRLDSQSPPVGEAGVLGEGDTQRFAGWLDLLRVLAELFAEGDG